MVFKNHKIQQNEINDLELEDFIKSEYINDNQTDLISDDDDNDDTY